MAYQYNTLKNYFNNVIAFVEPPISNIQPAFPGATCQSAVCTCQSGKSVKPKMTPEVNDNFEQNLNLNIEWKQAEKVTTSSPEVNGPPFWFTLHNGAAHLPKNISPISMARIRGFIDGIPEMQPCTVCSEHARAYIEKNRNEIDKMTTGDEVFKFFVDFHNYVNKRLNKRIVSVEEAKVMYKGGENVYVMKYN
jgi:hypothetical protein